MSFRAPVLAELEARGFIKDCTDPAGLDALLASGPSAVFAGFDCTADSLHVGHLLTIMMLRRLQEAGHRPIVLLGGGTTRVGDPSGRTTARPLLDKETIAANKKSLARVFERLLVFSEAPNGVLIVDNAEWLEPMSHLDFLREVGRHFPVSRMLSQESVRSRLETGLSFLEFGYMLLQAFDFVELARRHGCRLQIGGSDQWGNICAGIELARRMDGRALFGLTSPLLSTASGQKMGKTASGAVWLNADRLDPFAFCQFWRNTDDRDVGRLLKLFTDLPLDEIARLEALEGAELNAAKEILADEATRLVHGDAAAEAARSAAEAAFRGGGDGAMPSLTSENLGEAIEIPDLPPSRGTALQAAGDS